MSPGTTTETAVRRYFDTLVELLHGTAVTIHDGTPLSLDQGIDWMRRAAVETHARGNKIMFVGNGGSAGISSHLAIDYSENGGCRIVTLSGFGADNALRRAGDIYFYAESSEYGFVEVAHLSLCHAVLDIEIGWHGGYQAAAGGEAELAKI